MSENEHQENKSRMQDLASLDTERINEACPDLDTLDTGSLVRTLHDENRKVPEAIEPALPIIAALIDIIVERMRKGGRLIYVGAGTSGRLGVLDASECPPTFGVDADLVIGIIAGGDIALRTSVEGAEDSESCGAADLRKLGLASVDVVVGIAASGRTPYVIGALKYARSLGAYPAAIVNTRYSLLAEHADSLIEAVTGAEPLTGSTRLKAGTAQKLILNMLSTATMIRLGKVYGNLMVDLRATNEKLRDRAARIVQHIVGVDRKYAEILLEKAGGSTKVAIVMELCSTTRDEAEKRLLSSAGVLRKALEENQ